MPEVLYYVIFAGLLVCASLCIYRIGRGPDAPDRSVGIDMLGIVVVCFTALMSVKTGREFYLDIGIAWVLLSFVGAIALAKYLEGKRFDE